MPAKALREGTTALDRLGDIDDNALENGIRLLLGKHCESTQQRQPGIDERGQLAGENHQYPWLDGLPLEERNIDCDFLASCGFSGSGSLCDLGFGPLSLLGDAFWKVACLPQLRDRVGLGFRINDARRFLSA